MRSIISGLTLFGLMNYFFLLKVGGMARENKNRKHCRIMCLAFLLGIISLSLTGCLFSTYYAFDKVSPEITLQGYKSIYTTQDDIYFVIKVADRKTNTFSIWCAKLGIDDVTKNSIPIEVKPDTKRDEYLSIFDMSAISSSQYTLIHYDCITDLDKNSEIFFNPNYQDIVSNIKNNKGKYSLVVATPYPHNVKGYVYIAQKSKERQSTYYIARAQHPIINSARSKVRIAMLPLFVVLDVVTIPWQAFMWIHGPM